MPSPKHVHSKGVTLYPFSVTNLEEVLSHFLSLTCLLLHSPPTSSAARRAGIEGSWQPRSSASTNFTTLSIVQWVSSMASTFTLISSSAKPRIRLSRTIWSVKSYMIHWLAAPCPSLLNLNISVNYHMCTVYSVGTARTEKSCNRRFHFLFFFLHLSWM